MKSVWSELFQREFIYVEGAKVHLSIIIIYFCVFNFNNQNGPSTATITEMTYLKTVWECKPLCKSLEV